MTDKMQPNPVKEALADLERVKEFLGATIVVRGYGQEQYDAVCRTLKMLEALTQPAIPLLDPEMRADELRLHMGELTANEVRVARAAIRWANTRQPAIPEGMVLVPIEPTFAIIKAMAESNAKDDEGEFGPMCDLLGFSGENKTRTVLTAAYKAAIRSAPVAGNLEG